jgi:NADH dehydrogenase/NADH:ubiquinone oxidoreductase subunit G
MFWRSWQLQIATKHRCRSSDDWNGFNVLHTAAGACWRFGYWIRPGRRRQRCWRDCWQGDVDVLFSLGADELEIANGAFTVYIGTHGDRGAHGADVILPGAAYTEKSATYVNTEGRPQQTQRGAFPPGEAKEDWAILRALSEKLGKDAALTTRWNNCVPRSTPNIRIWPSWKQIANLPMGRSLTALAKKAPKNAGKAKFGRAFDDFLSDKSYCPRIQGDGRVFGDIDQA